MPEMNDTKNNLPQRKNVRMPFFDYSSPGGYFVTICVEGRKCRLGRIKDGEIILNATGEIVREITEQMPQIFSQIIVDCYVIMPNHFHAVFNINYERDGEEMAADSSSAGGTLSGGTTAGGSRTAPTGRAPKPIGRIIGAFKTMTTKRINEKEDTPGAQFWQRNYYEHVIRNDEELQKIRDYIIGNPVQWAADEENPDYIPQSGGL
jgi:putative transposase